MDSQKSRPYDSMVQQNPSDSRIFPYGIDAVMYPEPATVSSSSLPESSKSSSSRRCESETPPEPIIPFDVLFAVFSGLGQTLFNVLIGEYLNASITFNNKKDSDPQQMLHVVISLLAVGALSSFLAYFQCRLEPVSKADNNAGQKPYLTNISSRRSAVVIMIRDLTHLVSSVSTALFLAWSLTIPVLLMPAVTLAYVLLLKDIAPPYSGFSRAGPACFLFLNIAVFGLLPGYIFPVVLGVGSSTVQFSKSLVESINCENDIIKVSEIPAEILTKPFTRLKVMVSSSPILSVCGFVMVIVHAFGFPVFTRLTGMYFSVYENKIYPFDAGESERAPTEFFASGRGVCLAYAIMGLVVFVSMSYWNIIFAKIGKQQKSNKASKNGQECGVEHPADSVDDQFPLRFSEFLYGIVCLGLSIASALHNNVWMGGLAAAIFVLQVILFQFAISKIENFGKTLNFTILNGIPQGSQTLCYLGGYILVWHGLITPINIFKIVQTMHLGSVGIMASVKGGKPLNYSNKG